MQVTHVAGLDGMDGKGRMTTAMHGQAISVQGTDYSLDPRWHHSGTALLQGVCDGLTCWAKGHSPSPSLLLDCLHGVGHAIAELLCIIALFTCADQMPFAGGVEDWQVKCVCGTTDDDGARMVSCDGCGIWVHSHCNGVPDNENVPPNFLCKICTGSRGKKRGLC